MAGYKPTSPELKAQATAMRAAGATYAEITAATGVKKGALFNAFKAAGLTDSYATPPTPPAVQVSIQNFCLKCAKAIVIANAKFCYHCGSLILSEKELIQEELNVALKTLAPLGAVPAHPKDLIRDALLHSLAYLEKDK